MVAGRQLLVEDDRRWKTTFDGRQPSVADDLGRKTTFCGRRPLLEDDLRRKMKFGGRQPSVEDGLRRTLHADNFHYFGSWTNIQCTDVAWKMSPGQCPTRFL